MILNLLIEMDQCSLSCLVHSQQCDRVLVRVLKLLEMTRCLIVQGNRSYLISLQTSVRVSCASQFLVTIPIAKHLVLWA